MWKIPFTDDPAQSFTVGLGGVKYLFDARYNDIGGFWTFDISLQASQVQLVAGVPILIGQDMLAPYALSIGGLFAIDEVSGGIDAGPEDLGSRVVVLWLSPDELAAGPPSDPLPWVPPAVLVVPPVVVVTTPFTPLVLGSTLKLWLRGDLGVTLSGGNVTGIADQSGNGNDVVNSGTIPWVASSINGKPGWTNSNSLGTALVNTVSNILPAGSARTIFVVAKTTGAGGSLLSIRDGFKNAVYLLNQAGNPTFPNGIFADSSTGTATLATPPSAAAAHIVEYKAYAAPSYLSCVIDGVAQSVSQANPCVAESGATGFAIGSWLTNGSNGAYWAGDIVEVIVCDTILSLPVERQVQNYMGARYAIAVPA